MSDNVFSIGPEAQMISRRAAIKKSLSAGFTAGAIASAPGWVLPALAQGEELVPFSDMPEGYSRPPARPGGTHFLDTRQISSDSFYTDNQDFYVVQHYGQPELDLSSYRLEITGLVDNTIEYSLADLQAMPQFDLDVGFECGGNRPLGIFQGLIGNANWQGVRLRDILDAAGVQPDKERFARFLGVFHEVLGQRDDFTLVEVLHPFLGERTGVLDRLLAYDTKPGLFGIVEGFRCKTVYDATCSELLLVFLKAA